MAVETPAHARSEPGAARSSRPTYLLVLPWDLRHDNGGVNQVVRALYDGIERDGRMRPLTLVLSWDAARPVEERDSADRSIVRLRLMSFPTGTSVLTGLLRYMLRLPGELRRLSRFVKDYGVEVVNCHYIGASDPLWTIARVLGLYRGRLILSIHGLDIRSLARRRGLARVFWRGVLRRADAIVACSEGLATETMQAFSLSAGKVVTIHNGFDSARLGKLVRAGADSAKTFDGPPTLLNLGTFEPKKGHDVLLRAFKKVLAKYPSAQLTIMGRRAESADATTRLRDELGLGQHVSIRFDVPHEAALDALSDAHVFVLPSRNEAFSIALLEAGAFGKPVVATNVCGVAELIESGETGIVVPPEDVDALAQGILAMIENPSQAEAYARKLQARVAQQFTAERTCQGYLRLIGLADRAAQGETAVQTIEANEAAG